MKKLIILVCAVVFLFGVIGFAQAQQRWAPYKNKIVPDGTRGVPSFRTAEGYLDCCACHGRTPSAPPMPGTCP